MARIPFVGPFYQARSLNADAQRAVNVYLEMDNASPRAPFALYGTPGMLLKFALANTPVRAAIRQGIYSYWVAGNSVYRVDTAYTAVLLGTINSGAGPVSLSSNGTQVLIVDGVGGWLATDSALTQITDVDFPNGVTVATYLSTYFVVAGDGSGKFYWSETPNSGTDWNGLDFATAEGSPDNTLGLLADHLELWIVGSDSAEVFVVTDDPNLPFQRNGNTFIEHGTASGSTLAKLDNTVYWLGADDRGAGTVYKADGYTPIRISTHPLEKVIQGYADISDAFAYTYQLEGHSYYVLTFPTADATWVYDVATQQWFQWAWRDPDDNTLHRHRSNCHVFFNNKHLVGDFETGNVYALDLDTYTDNGDPILRLRATQTMNADGLRQFFSSMQVDMETGVGLAIGQGSAPLLMMRYSDDGGHTWSDIRTVSIGAAGEYGARALFHRLGSGRNRVFEISMTDPVRFAVLGAFASVSKGSS